MDKLTGAANPVTTGKHYSGSISAGANTIEPGLVERVALALHASEVKLFGYNEDAADDLWRRQARNYKRQAQAAIAAIRPSPQDMGGPDGQPAGRQSPSQSALSRPKGDHQAQGEK